MLVDRAERLNLVGPYQLQAAIAAVHAEAKSAAETDWPQIVLLYDALLQLNPSPVIELNRAAAVAMASGPEDGLALMDVPTLSETLTDYRWFHSARADLLRRLGRREEAASAYRTALDLTDNGGIATVYVNGQKVLSDTGAFQGSRAPLVAFLTLIAVGIQNRPQSANASASSGSDP